MLITSTAETYGLQLSYYNKAIDIIKFLKAFTKFYHRHSELIVKYNIGLKLFCNKAYLSLCFMVI